MDYQEVLDKEVLQVFRVLMDQRSYREIQDHLGPLENLDQEALQGTRDLKEIQDSLEDQDLMVLQGYLVTKDLLENQTTMVMAHLGQ